jgi:molybdate transport system regulatory protein
MWVICGTGRGVGKTHFAKRLCEALGDAVYAKRGCGRRKAGRPTNYFRTEAELISFVDRCRGRHEHMVVECSAWAAQGRGDIIVFLDGTARNNSARSDVAALRSQAHLHVGPGGSVRAWKRVLRGKLADRAAREAICDLLAEQNRFLGKSSPAVRTKVWFVLGEEHTFGVGLASLLENVDHHGTLRQAARAARISYRRAWDLIKSAEKHLGKPLLVARPGGAGGGWSTLSPDGRRMLSVFKRVNADVAAFADSRAAALLEKEDGSG